VVNRCETECKIALTLLVIDLGYSPFFKLFTKSLQTSTTRSIPAEKFISSQITKISPEKRAHLLANDICTMQFDNDRVAITRLEKILAYQDKCIYGFFCVIAQIDLERLR
jgi:hypothetical protein